MIIEKWLFLALVIALAFVVWVFVANQKKPEPNKDDEAQKPKYEYPAKGIIYKFEKNNLGELWKTVANGAGGATLRRVGKYTEGGKDNYLIVPGDPHNKVYSLNYVPLLVLELDKDNNDDRFPSQEEIAKDLMDHVARHHGPIELHTRSSVVDHSHFDGNLIQRARIAHEIPYVPTTAIPRISEETLSSFPNYKRLGFIDGLVEKVEAANTKSIAGIGVGGIVSEDIAFNELFYSAAVTYVSKREMAQLVTLALGADGKGITEDDLSTDMRKACYRLAVSSYDIHQVAQLHGPLVVSEKKYSLIFKIESLSKQVVEDVRLFLQVCSKLTDEKVKITIYRAEGCVNAQVTVGIHSYLVSDTDAYLTHKESFDDVAAAGTLMNELSAMVPIDESKSVEGALVWVVDGTYQYDNRMEYEPYDKALSSIRQE